jgi:hypothetical protein
MCVEHPEPPQSWKKSACAGVCVPSLSRVHPGPSRRCTVY